MRCLSDWASATRHDADESYYRVPIRAVIYAYNKLYEEVSGHCKMGARVHQARQ